MFCYCIDQLYGCTKTHSCYLVVYALAAEAIKKLRGLAMHSEISLHARAHCRRV